VLAGRQKNAYGAGKTTTVRILAGLVWPDRGHAGFDAVS
jgi:ABC-type multidrug transport system ATPase subunit